MKDEWTKEIREKLCDYESEQIPDELWDRINEELNSYNKVVPFFARWRKAGIAAILLAMCFVSGMLFYDVEQKEPQLAINRSSGALIPDKMEAAGNATAIAGQTSIRRVTVLSLTSDNIKSMESAVEESEATKSSEDSTVIGHNETIPAADANNENTTGNIIADNSSNGDIYKQDNIAIPHHHERCGLSFAMVASGINISMNLGNGSGDAQYNDESHSYYDTSSSIPGGTDITIPEVFPVHSANHSRPLSFGFQIGVPIAHHLTAVTGVSYMYLHSDITDGTSQHYDNITRRIHLVGVPLRVNYSLYSDSRWNVYVGAGGRMDIGVYGRDKVETVEEGRSSMEKTVHLDRLPVYFSLMCEPGVQLRLFNGLNIYMEPSIQYNLPCSYRYETYITEHRWMPDLHFGLRWNTSR